MLTVQPACDPSKVGRFATATTSAGPTLPKGEHVSRAPRRDATERILTVEELSRRLNVSTKTISRWRQRGLVSCRFVSDGRQRVGFLQSSVQRFIRQNPERVRRGTEFSQLTDAQRQRILDRARQLAQAGEFPADVIKRLADESGRSAETIRYTLRHFDEDHPDSAIFPDHTGPVREETKRRIFRKYRQGAPIETLASEFCRTKASVRRIVAELRARRIMELPLEYVPHDDFADPRREKAILGPTPPADHTPRKVRLPSDLPAYLASLYEIPLLTGKQEAHLFRKMNYLKHKASQLREGLDLARPKARVMSQIEKFFDASVAVKNEIVRANLRLVVSIAKQHVNVNNDFFELVSDGNVSLIRAVEKFDFARGFKFSTYASVAIMKNFARTIPEEHRHRDRFRTSYLEVFADTEDTRTDQSEQETAQLQREAKVQELMTRLDERERKIVDRRFGLTRGREPLTLKQVGAEIGVTKERVRQIEARAMSKLRESARERAVALSVPG